MSKTITDEQLEQMGLLTKQMREQAVQVWAIAMKGMNLNSIEYRQVCNAGKNIQQFHLHLRELAELRRWPSEKIETVFSNNYAYFR